MSDYKHPLEYIWSWAESSGLWAKSLINHIATGQEINQEIRDEVYHIFLSEIGLGENLATPVINKPNFSLIFDGRSLLLKHISDVCGVNKLAKNQKIDFSKNLTVVYGKNASGKTGYCRILKNMGYSYSNEEDNIISNVFKNEEDTLKAEICYEVDGCESTVIWGASDDCDILSKIAVFNDSCVTLSLNDRRELVAIPEGFHFFNVAKNEINLLHQRAQEEIARKRAKPSCFADIKENTESHRAINGFTQTSKKEDFDKFLEDFGDVDSKIESLKKQIQELNKPLLEAKNKDLDNKRKELIELYNNIWTNKGRLSREKYDKLVNFLVELSSLRRQQNETISEVAENKGISFYESEEFKAFLTAAEKYIIKLGKIAYPENQDVCVYCNQPLGAEAVDLIKFYRKLLSNELQKEIDAKKEKLSKYKDELGQISTPSFFRYSPFETDEKNAQAIPAYYTDVSSSIDLLKDIFLITAKEEGFPPYVGRDFEISLLEINKLIMKLLYDMYTNNKSLLGIEEKHKEYSDQLTNLEAVKILKTHKDEVLEYVEGIKQAFILDQKKVQFNATLLSSKSTVARQEIIENEFHAIFTEEKKAFCCPDYVNINFGTSNSNPQLRQEIVGRHKLEDILSEGEQKSISLAEFITELRTAKQANPVIFDDPVNSLDHERKTLIAKRLIDLSLERQVVVFTHSILFFYGFEQELSKASRRRQNIEYKCYSVDTDIDYAGYIYGDSPPHEENFNSYKTKINKILNCPKENRIVSESTMAIEGYEALRSSIELLVEDSLFQKCVKRYKRNVMLTNFELIDGAFIDSNKRDIVTIFERACGYIDAHSNPQEEAISPTLIELKKDFDVIVDLYNQIKR
ncbi:MAG: AAA family ATPase [Candidatus Aceula meridiana]|nr:AAA family ATPase [Candidatus Aceula meridiana]